MLTFRYIKSSKTIKKSINDKSLQPNAEIMLTYVITDLRQWINYTV